MRCFPRGRPKLYEPERVLVRRFKQYRYGAETRGLIFMSYKNFKSFWRAPCHYCGASIDTIGLDRLDSSKGYRITNVVPCCSRCNKMKSDMSVEDFIQRCEAVVNFWKARFG